VNLNRISINFLMARLDVSIFDRNLIPTGETPVPQKLAAQVLKIKSKASKWQLHD